MSTIKENGLASSVALLLNRIRKSFGERDRRTVAEVWSVILELDPAIKDNPYLLYEALTIAWKSVHLLRQRVTVSTNLTDAQKLILRETIDSLIAIFEPKNLQTPMATYLQAVSIDKIRQIELMARIIDTEFLDPQITDAEIAEIDNELAVLIDTIKKADIPNDLKLMILPILSMVRWALNSFHYLGTQALVEISAATIARIVPVWKQAMASTNPSSETKIIVSRSKLIFSKLWTALRFTNDTFQGIEYGSKVAKAISEL